MNKDRAHCRACMARRNVDKMYTVRMPITEHEMFICEECFLSKSHKLTVIQLPIGMDENKFVNFCNNVAKISTINLSPTPPMKVGEGDSVTEKIQPEIFEPEKERKRIKEKEATQANNIFLSLFKKIIN